MLLMFEMLIGAVLAGVIAQMNLLQFNVMVL